MLELTSEPREHRSHWTRDGGEGQSALREWERPAGPPVGLLVAGAVVLGLGILAWTYLGPDLRRYMKIHSM